MKRVWYLDGSISRTSLTGRPGARVCVMSSFDEERAGLEALLKGCSIVFESGRDAGAAGGGEGKVVEIASVAMFVGGDEVNRAVCECSCRSSSVILAMRRGVLHVE